MGGLDVLIEPDAGRGPSQDAGERGLAGHERLAPQILAVKLDEVERVEEGAFVVPALAQPIKI